VDKLIGRLTRAGGEPVHMEDHIFGVIGTVALGNIYGTEQFTHKQHFHDVIDEAVRAKASFSAEDYFPNAAGRLADRLTGAASRREKVFRDLDAFFDLVIDQHLDPSRAAPENGPADLIDVMVALMRKQRSLISFTRDHIKGLLSVRAYVIRICVVTHPAAGRSPYI
jgi:4-hydroxyphenylacetaldehyde oxime monooxygenase